MQEVLWRLIEAATTMRQMPGNIGVADTGARGFSCVFKPAFSEIHVNTLNTRSSDFPSTDLPASINPPFRSFRTITGEQFRIISA
jgi:hypothetical protein